jgi:hypothetical protein
MQKSKRGLENKRLLYKVVIQYIPEVKARECSKGAHTDQSCSATLRVVQLVDRVWC